MNVALAAIDLANLKIVVACLFSHLKGQKHFLGVVHVHCSYKHNVTTTTFHH